MTEPVKSPCIGRCGAETFHTGRYVQGHDELCPNVPQRPEWRRRTAEQAWRHGLVAVADLTDR